MTSDLTAATMARASQATIMSTHRERYVDVFRGLLIAHMALDHASLMLNGGRGGEESAAAAPAFPSDIWQFLTRFTGIPVAPAFRSWRASWWPSRVSHAPIAACRTPK